MPINIHCIATQQVCCTVLPFPRVCRTPVSLAYLLMPLGTLSLG